LGDRIPRKLINIFLVCKVHPIFPLLRLWNVAVIVDGASVKCRWQNLVFELLYSLDLTVAKLLEELVEGTSALSVDCNTQ
jgi:hypothetical protein